LLEKLDLEIRERGAGKLRPSVISFSNAAADHFNEVYARRGGVSAEQARRVATTLHGWCNRYLSLKEPRMSYILPAALRHLRNHMEQVRARLAGHLMLVDEAQDLTPEQLRILQLLLRLNVEVILVGDPRQAIFGFTGASPQSMTSLRRSSKPTELRTNWRSTWRIVRAANALCTLQTSVPTGLEFYPAQTARPNAPEGEVPTLSFCLSLQFNHLGGLAGLIKSAQERRRGREPGAACVVTYLNADVEKLHQNLSLLKVLTLAITCSGDDGATEPIAGDLKNGSDYVHVRTIHSVKGDEYDTVILVVKGFDTPEDATAAHEGAEVKDAQEELRRYYVGLTRAKCEVHVVIYGNCPPVWWRAVMRVCEANGNEMPFKVAPPCIPANENPRAAAPEAREPKPVPIWELCRKYQAGDHLITLYGEAARNLLSETGDLRAGVLARSKETLPSQGGAVDVRPHEQLSRLHVAALQRHVLIFLALHRLAPRALAESVQHALAFMQRVPLVPFLQKAIRTMGTRAPQSSRPPVMETREFYSKLAERLREWMRSPNAATGEALRTFVTRLADPAAVDREEVTRALKDLACHGKHKTWFAIGQPGSTTATHVEGMLSDVIQGVRASPEKTMFRDRITILDTKALADFRGELVEAGCDFLNGADTPRVLTRCALLVHLCASGGLLEGRHRALPYFASSDERMRLSLDDMLPPELTVANLKARMDALSLRLLQHHTAEQLARSTVHATVLRPAAAPDIPRELVGTVHWRVPGGPGGDTVVQLACGTAATLHEEVHTVVAAAMAEAQRAFLYEAKSGVLHGFDVSKPSAILKHACQGLREKDGEIRAPGDGAAMPGPRGRSDEGEAAASRLRSRTPPRAHER
jgi:hypothetical protein